MAKKQRLTPPELAAVWGVRPECIRGLIESGALKAFNISQSRKPRWLISIAAIDEFEKRRGNQKQATRRRRPRKSTSVEYF